jgi:adenosylmethionine-8-amino-7-oxononanoate aminotransferase
MSEQSQPSHVFPRSSKVVPPVVASGDGCYLIDVNGKRYLDACGGAAVSCLGHSNQRVVDAVSAQLNRVAYAHTSFFSSEPAEQLADMLIARAPAGIDRVYFVSGGSEAVESAIKLARQYHLERGEPQRQHVIARLQSYHGNTLGALSAGGNLWRRKQFQPLLSNAMHHIDACHYWRWAAEDETPEQYALRAANLLEQKILELGADSVSAFLVEPVVGATLGAVTAPDGYFQRIREICDRYGVVLIFDEVMCGMGRTGTLFASEAEHTAPDIVCIAKGLGAGIQPLGAMLCSAQIYAAIEQGSGFFQHGHTYLAHPAACAAGVAVLSEIEERNLLDNVRQRGQQLTKALQQRFGNHPHVGEIRGRGLFIGLEIVADRASKEPFDPARRLHAVLKKTAFENGLMIYPMGGTIDGEYGDHALLAPPFIVEDAQLEELVDKLARSVDQTLASAA